MIQVKIEGNTVNVVKDNVETNLQAMVVLFDPVSGVVVPHFSCDDMLMMQGMLGMMKAVLDAHVVRQVNTPSPTVLQFPSPMLQRLKGGRH